MIGCSVEVACADACLFGESSQHLAALEADAQMQPAAAGGQAVLAAGNRLGELRDLDVIQVGAGGHRGSLAIRVG